MATTPIVTEVTKAQLDALVAANGLNEGLQYKVTDKDWLLLAISNESLITIENSIKLIIPETLPTYIMANRIIYISEILEGVGESIDLIFNAELNYVCKSLLLSVITTDGDIGFKYITFTIGGNNYQIGLDMDIYDNTILFDIPNITQMLQNPNAMALSIAVVGGNVNTCKVVFETEKLYNI